MDAARRSTRYPAEQPLAVRCESWAEFVQLYASDIGQGGMFIITEDAPPILSTIEIMLQLPEATDVRLAARVVHVAEANPATGGRPGIGVEFVDLDPARKKQIHQLIEFARWQGVSGDPNASLARTMWEVSPSLPPTKVGDALPAQKVPAGTSPRPDSRKITFDGSEGRAQPAARDPRPESRKVTLDGERSTQGVARARSVTLDGTEKGSQSAAGDPRPESRKITLDGVQKSSRPPDARKATLDGVEKSAERRASQTAPSTAAPEVSTSAASQPADPAKLKLVLTNFAHKRYDQALTLVREILATSPNETQALKWQAMCYARMALAKNDEKNAVVHYEKALQYDESNREAREFVRTFAREKRLAGLPFGRYFSKK
jgi:uncharacterized protein (TIGR02266 family)